MKWQAALAGFAALAFYTWWVYGLGTDSVEAKVITITVTEEKRQAEGVGELKAGDAKHGQLVKEAKQRAAGATAPLGCDRADIGDLRVELLGGVRN